MKWVRYYWKYSFWTVREWTDALRYRWWNLRARFKGFWKELTFGTPLCSCRGCKEERTRE